MAEEGASGRPRYVWDKDKLAWVETAEKIAADDERTVPLPARGEETPAEAEYITSVSEEPIPAYEEAEAIEYKGVVIRIVGTAIDVIVLFLFAMVFNQILNILNVNLISWVMPVIGMVYFMGFWTWRGQSLGKMAIGAKIVKLDGSPIGIGRSILRYIGYYIYLAAVQYSITYVGWYLFLIVAIAILLVMFLNKKRRGFHDILAGTIVVNSRPKLLDEYDGYEEAIEDEEWAEYSTEE